MIVIHILLLAPRVYGRKEKGSPRKWSAAGGSSRSTVLEAALIYSGSYVTQETPKVASSGGL